MMPWSYSSFEAKYGIREMRMDFDGVWIKRVTLLGHPSRPQPPFVQVQRHALDRVRITASLDRILNVALIEISR
jgi:hypothetical protein